MIEDTPIVKDTRRVRSAISEYFKHDSDEYIDYLLKKESTRENFSSDVEDTDRTSTEH